MRAAIMQPYFLPYIGYIQLIAASDVFVVYDDVNFINRGWINRNNLLLNGVAHKFTVPLMQASQNKKINEISRSLDPKWQQKLLRTIEMAYRKAPQFGSIFPWVKEIINHKETNLAKYVTHSLKEVAKLLDINTRFISSSKGYHNQSLKAGDRLMDICKQEGATGYINPSGGQTLYTKEQFAVQGIELQFLAPKPISYPQFEEDKFVPWLSILDVLMFLSTQEIKSQLLGTAAYDLI